MDSPKGNWSTKGVFSPVPDGISARAALSLEIPQPLDPPETTSRSSSRPERPCVITDYSSPVPLRRRLSTPKSKRSSLLDKHTHQRTPSSSFQRQSIATNTSIFSLEQLLESCSLNLKPPPSIH
ncbi:hypothetical protein GEMRC1_010116 [Eukaryota sp. GEM-RC1]